MNNLKAILFDLDDTLLDRDQAVENMFCVILEKCYGAVTLSVKKEMLQAFKESDLENYGYNDKSKVLEIFFNEFPPKYTMSLNSVQDFWNEHFPLCFSINQNTINIINTIKKQVQVAIITNGSTQRQKAKIVNTNLNQCFDIIIISEEVGFSKPDKCIFKLALHKLGVQPEEALFVGDDLEKDMIGCQNINMKGIWFNPHKKKNPTDTKPFAEIHSFDQLLNYLT